MASDEGPGRPPAGIARLPLRLFRHLLDMEGDVARCAAALERQGLRAVQLWRVFYAGRTASSYSLSFEPLEEAPSGAPPSALAVGFPSEGEAADRVVAAYVARGADEEEDERLEREMASGMPFSISLSRIVRRKREGEGPSELLIAPTPELLAPRASWESVVLEAVRDEDLVVRDVEEGLAIAAYPARSDRNLNAAVQEDAIASLRERVRGIPFVFRLLDPVLKAGRIKVRDDVRAWRISPDARAAVIEGRALTVGVVGVESYIEHYLWTFQQAGSGLSGVDIKRLADAMSVVIPVHGRELRAYFNKAILSIAYEGHSLAEEALAKSRADLESALQ